MPARRSTYVPPRPAMPLRLPVLAAALSIVASAPAGPAPASAAELEFQWGHPRPQGNAIFGFAFQDDDTGWAVGGGGLVLRTDDGAVTWSLLHGPVGPASSLNDVAALPGGTLIAAGSDERIYRSTDGGTSWAGVANPAPGELRDLAPGPGGGISAAGIGGSVIVSTDDGSTWTERGPGTGVIRHHLWRNALEGYAVGENVSHRTTDGGTTWTQITDFGAFGFNEVYFAGALNGFIVEDFGTWESTDGGATWTEMFAPIPPLYRYRSLVLSPTHWMTVTLFEGGELWETTDAGTSWTQRLDRFIAGFPCMTRLPGGRILFGSDVGDLFRTDDLGQTVFNAAINLTEGAPAAPMNDLLARPDGVLFAANQPNSSGLTQSWLRSDDGGLSWFAPARTPGLWHVDAKGFFDDSSGLVTYRNLVRPTTDGGATWLDVTLETDRRTWDVALPAADRFFLATSFGGGGGDLLKSTDGGLAWAPVGGGLPSGTFEAASVEFADAQNGFVSGRVAGQSRLYRTTTGGASWLLVPTAGLPGVPGDMHWFDASTGLATIQTFPDYGIYRTTNAGAGWTQVSDFRSGQLVFRDAHVGMAIGFYEGYALRTEDAGLTWTQQAVPLFGPAPGAQIAQVTTVVPRENGWVFGGSNNRILVGLEGAATGSGLVESGDGARTDPGRCRFVGAWPNPVRFATSLRFELAVAGPVRLTIHDVSGRRVREVLAESRGAGRHAAVWDGRDDAGRPLAAGVYLARLVGAGAMDTEKIVLVK